jgi:hypothetical protein
MMRIDCRGASGANIAKSEELRLAYESLVKDGCVVLDHVLPEERVQALRAEFDRRYAKYLEASEFEDTLKVGNRRFMIPIELSGGFGDPLVYAHPFVATLARAMLDQSAVLESFGAVISFSGSRAQHIHRDGPPLFDSAISPMLPAHALTFVLPLVEMNEANGSTALWPGSHRWKKRDESVPPEAPRIPLGSCALWDFRLFHGGTANGSDAYRPIVYATYARRWYSDPTNFDKAAQRRLTYDGDFLRSVPEDSRTFFAHVR